MERKRLRAVIQVPFTKSEETNFAEALASRHYGALIRSLQGDDAIAFISQGQNQIVFIHGYDEVQDAKRKWRVLSSSRIRISRGSGLSSTFEPKMLANYAKQAGLELIGLKLFEEFYKNLMGE